MNDNDLKNEERRWKVIVCIIFVLFGFFTMCSDDGGSSSSSSKRECGYCGSSDVKAGTNLCYDCYNNMKGMESWLEDMN